MKSFSTHIDSEIDISDDFVAEAYSEAASVVGIQELESVWEKIVLTSSDELSNPVEVPLKSVEVREVYHDEEFSICSENSVRDCEQESVNFDDFQLAIESVSDRYLSFD